LYVGQIVECQGNEGAAPVNAAAGAADTTGKVVPFGVVVGTNLYNSSYNTTQQADQITDTTPHDSTVEYVLHEGVWARGDRVAMVEIALITPETIIKGPIFNGALNTATILGTVTAGSASGVTATVNALEVAGVATLATVYFRGGENVGAYRVTDDTSTTVIAWDKPTTKDVAIGDTLVRVNGLRPIGPSYAQFDTEAMYIDSAAALTTDYYVLDVIKLDLSEAGKEHVFFKFNADHFTLKRA
jgi:hypothetical protein